MNNKRPLCFYEKCVDKQVTIGKHVKIYNPKKYSLGPKKKYKYHVYKCLYMKTKLNDEYKSQYLRSSNRIEHKKINKTRVDDKKLPLTVLSK